MQSSVQMNPDSSIANTETIEQVQRDPQEEDNSSSLDRGETLLTVNEEATRMPGTEEVTHKAETNPLDLDPAKALTVAAKHVQPKTKKQDKAVRDGRKYVPSKKAMTDPLKIDMSKPPDLPLTSSQISLQCIECHIIFSDHKSKERHLKSSHPAEYEQSILRNALFACYVCDRHFTNSAELMAHQKTHLEKKPFKCPICGQSFCKSSELTLHKKIHFGRDGYTCTDCGKPCKTLTLLKYHRRTHTGERPYVCKDCGKRFSMPKALQKHMESHMPEGAQPKNGASSVMYACSICKATFKSTKTRHHHMKTKHNVSKVASSKTSAQQVKQCIPIITPISISESSLLQVGPHGPLQKVDANIDTEQIRKLIESLGNVQRVNQVVILGQVPPNAPPLEVQQTSELTQPLTLNLNPTQINFMGLNQPDSKPTETSEDPMEQTIILEPITPDGQLINPPFSELGSNMGASDRNELTLVETEQRENSVGQVMVLQQPAETNTIQLAQPDQLVCHNEVMEQNLEPDLDQTIILELTPALTPTVELEQSQHLLQTEMPSSTLEQMNELERPLDETPISEQETSLSVQSLMSTVELELIPIQTEQQITPACTSISQETLPEYNTETVTKDEPDSLMKTEGLAHVQTVTEIEEKTEQTDEETTEQGVTAEHEPTNVAEDKENAEICKGDNPDDPQIETKQPQLNSELPINVMSAQELVKVRKRKPPKAFFFQGYMQEFVGSIYSDDFQNNNRTAKRKRTKKSHLVVKFGPHSKEKKPKKTSKPSKQQPTQEELKGKARTATKVQKKGRKDKKVVHSECTAEIEVPALSEDQDLQYKQKNTGKNSKKKQKVGAKKNEKHIGVASPVFKKKQKKTIQQSQSKNVKEKTITNIKQKRNLSKEKKKSSAQTKAESAERPSPHIAQESLLLLKGHKQPQLKVHKLDPLKAAGKTQDVLTSESQTSPKRKDNSVSHESNESANSLLPESKKKGRRSKKALTLLSSLHTSKKTPETTPTKPKTTRKRKASSNVETEGVITSKRALECKDCGQRFSEVSLLQKHKTTVHIVESPGLTYTNGNLFEGVSGIDIYKLPKQHNKVIGAICSGTGWDTEPEMGELDRESCVSFPALNASPSSPVPPSDVYCTYVDKVGKNTSADGLSMNSSEVLTQSPRILVTEEDKSSTDTEVQATINDDIKEDLLLEVDLVTVGEHCEKHNLTPSRDNASQNTLTGSDNAVCGISEHSALNETDPTSHTVSCSTHQMAIKDEEEEIIIQKNKEGGKWATTGIERKEGEVLVDEPQREEDTKNTPDDCEVVYEKPAVDSDSNNNPGETHHSQSASQTLNREKMCDVSAPNVAATASVLPSSRGEVPKEQAIVEQELATTRTEKETNEPRHQGSEESERDESPGIIFEQVLTSANKEKSQTQLFESENQGIKVEDNTADSTQITTNRLSRGNLSIQPPCRGIRTVLVKEESSLLINDAQTPQRGEHMHWNVELDTTENSSSPLMEVMEATPGCSIATNFNSSQCIFYPVKEEEREVLLGTSESDSRPVSSGVSSVTLQSEQHTTEDGVNATQENQEVRGLSSEPVVNNFSDEHEAEWQTTPNLRDFLLESSDEEDPHDEMCDFQLDSEAEVMAYFYKKQNNCTNQPDVGYSTSSNPVQDKAVEKHIKQPIEYFSKYFSWDMWREISNCTNKLTNMSTPVTAEEVAQFVGVHIAMGTLKFPSPLLYWEDLTKVPLVADAMSLSRFLELSRMLKLAYPRDTQPNSNSRKGDNNNHSSVCNNNHHEKLKYQKTYKTVKTDPLWKIQPILQCFLTGCQSLRGEGNYAIDQYPLPLTGKTQSNKLSLHCTTLISFVGMVLHVDFKLDLSDKESVVEKMAPKSSMVFFCKQELSTPAMLEHLLTAGVHGAGRVGGARGQIGDEFVSSDGKLMLRRSHCGFILSTTGNCQRNEASMVDNFEKAQISARLNKDLQNLYSIPLTGSAPGCWPQAVLWYLTDLALINSWLLYRQDARDVATPLTLLAFRLEVSKALILSSGSDTQDSVSHQPPTENAHATSETPNPSLLDESPLPDAATRYDGSGHWPEQLAEGEGGRCRFGDCQRTSRVLCLKCCVFLCISRNHNCFLNFHSQGSQRKE